MGRTLGGSDIHLCRKEGCMMSSKSKRLSWVWWVAWWALGLAPLVAACVALPLVSESIPAHFGIDGQVDRWGSRWELCVLPVVVAVFAVAMAVWMRRDGPDARPRAAIVMVGLASLDAVSALSIAAALPQARMSIAPLLGSGSLTYPILGAAMVIIGAILPGLKPNSLVGVRVPGCMDPVRWPLLQRFGSHVFIVGGLVELFVCLFWLRDAAAFYFTIVLMATACVAVLAYGRQVVRRG